MKSSIYLIIILFIYSCATVDTLNVHKLRDQVELIEVKKVQKHIEGTGQLVNKVKIYSLKKGEKVTYKIESNNILNITNVKKDLKAKDSLFIPDTYPIETIKDKKEIPYSFALGGFIDTLFKMEIQPKSTTLKRDFPYKNEKYKQDFFIGKTIKFKQFKQSLQPITIPYKIHFATKDADSQISTGINIAVGYSFKSIYKSYKPILAYDQPKKNVLGYRESSFDFSLTPMLGLTVIELKKSNTKPEIEKEKKILGLSTGLLGIVGISNFDLGIGLGFDFGFGPDAKKWHYQNKPWVGIAVGLDIYK